MATPAAFPTPGQDGLRGIAYRCGSVFCFAMMSGFMKVASVDNMGTFELVFYRSLMGLPLVLAWIAIGPGFGAIFTKRPRAHATRSAIGVVGILMNFKAILLLPLAASTTIGFTAPIFATILSAAVLGEKVGARRWGAVLLGFCGIAVVMRPGGEPLSHFGIACGLLGAMGTAGVMVTIRSIRGAEHPAVIVFWFFVTSAVVGGIGTLHFGHVHSWPIYALLFGGAIMGATMQLLMTMSLGAAPIAVIAPFDYTQIIWAVMLDWMIWNQPPAGQVFAGTALIVASGLYTAWREHRLHRSITPAEPLLE